MGGRFEISKFFANFFQHFQENRRLCDLCHTFLAAFSPLPATFCQTPLLPSLLNLIRINVWGVMFNGALADLRDFKVFRDFKVLKAKHA